jgi:hypothetical protein
MWRLGQWVLFSVAGTLAGMIFIIAAGRLLKPSLPFAALFTTPEGQSCQQPCMFGVRMGHTSYEEALSLLAAHPLTSGLPSQRSVGRNGMVYLAEGVTVGLSRNAEGVISQIDIQVEPYHLRQSQNLPVSGLSAMRFGDMVAGLGAPDYIEPTVDQSWRVTVAYYRAANLRIVYNQSLADRPQTHAPLRSLYMNLAPTSFDSVMFTWLGYTNFRRYYDHHFAQ